MLTEDQKRARVNVGRELLSLYQQDEEGFLFRIVTQDETWVHHFDPETKKQEYAMEAYCICTRLTAYGYFGTGETINGKYYASLCTKLREVIMQKRMGKLSRGVMQK